MDPDPQHCKKLYIKKIGQCANAFLSRSRWKNFSFLKLTNAKETCLSEEQKHFQLNPMIRSLFGNFSGPIRISYRDQDSFSCQDDLAGFRSGYIILRPPGTDRGQ
jgi:hypothetical protein